MKQENQRKNAKKYHRFPLLGRNSYDFITKIKMRSKPLSTFGNTITHLWFLIHIAKLRKNE